ncbi:Site-specific recombinase XerD [Chitinasiproducens palmae]|uniref:Site-specific recombinase XerD n=2 Tax=Chitinasiproducens palmae TaxID=1770053 RepID=A0A1H2PRI4_9BURK|nr:Site-specific recombinase XerD [Chitinasiproducens palmae]
MRARHRGATTYYFFDLGGRPRKEVSLGTDFVAAVRKWSELEQAKIPRAAVVTFDYAATRYMKEVLPTKRSRTQADNLKELPYLRQFFGDPPAPLDEIRPVHVRQYLSWRIEKSRARLTELGRDAPANAGAIRANREIALFSHIFNFARQHGLTDAPNPCVGVNKHKETGRNVYVEDDIYKRVYEAADAAVRDALDLAYLTGQRPADTLAFDERDIKDGELWLSQGKTDHKLRIEITGELAQVIERIRARKRTYEVVSTSLIVNESGERLTAYAFRARFDKARKTAGVDKAGFQFRDLRAKAGTDKAESAGDIRKAQLQLGHKSVGMTEHYVRRRKGDKVGPTR